jgi:hypothetical protein
VLAYFSTFSEIFQRHTFAISRAWFDRLVAVVADVMDLGLDDAIAQMLDLIVIVFVFEWIEQQRAWLLKRFERYSSHLRASICESVRDVRPNSLERRVV